MERGEVSCPVCGDTAVSKAPMAPRIGRGGSVADDRRREVQAQNQAEAARLLSELRSTIEQNCDYVGDRFAEEARRIHYGETDAHGIYGETTQEEAQALKDEGVDCYRVPWLPRSDS